MSILTFLPTQFGAIGENPCQFLGIDEEKPWLGARNAPCFACGEAENGSGFAEF